MILLFCAVFEVYVQGRDGNQGRQPAGAHALT